LAEATIPIAIPPQIPELYFNSLVMGLTNADVNMTLMIDNQPQIRLHLSFTTAKTLQKYLGEAIARLESVTKHEIMIVSEVEAGLQKMNEQVVPS